jgi:hypothetical protein
MAFRNNRLLAPFYRQTPAGDSFGDTSMVMSPDAGQTWIDYGRYNTYSVTAASCIGTTATLSVTGANGLTGPIYVHDIGAVYNGKQTIATSSTSQITFTVSTTCTGATGSTGYFGPLSTDGSAPLGPTSGSYNMMWPVVNGYNPMSVQSFINYGQDGNYSSGIEPACDPTVWVCGLATDRVSVNNYKPDPWGMVLYRVPVGQEMTKAAYQWYSCLGYNPYWGVAETVCDGNRDANWASDESLATKLMYNYYQAGIWPGVIIAMRYMPSHDSYLTSGVQVTTVAREAMFWAPHPWGPFYPVGTSECSESDANHPYGCVASEVLMDYGENVISTSPPQTQVRISAKSDEGSMGTVGFWTVETATGRVPVTGAARRADYMGISGQLGMGHRFVSGNEAGAISRRGPGYSLDWWTDVWDHGGMTCCGAQNRPFFRDLLSSGAKYFQAWDADGGDHVGLGHSSMTADGVAIPYGYGPRLQSYSADTTLSANSGNSSWTFLTVFELTTAGNNTLMRIGGAVADPYPLNNLIIGASVKAAGDLCLSYSANAYETTFCLPGGTLTTGVWYSLAISAQHTAAWPIYRIYLGTGGTVTEYGGVDLSVAGDGITGNGITKHCSASSPTGNRCTSGPAISATVLGLGGSNHEQSGGSLNGVQGDSGLYSGVVPSHVIREIYRTLQKDWARVGRGTL